MKEAHAADVRSEVACAGALGLPPSGGTARVRVAAGPGL